MRRLLKMNLIRYALVGGVSFIADYLLLIGLYHGFHVALVVASSVGFIAGMVFNFIANKYWSFGNTADSVHKTGKQVVLYVGLVGFNLLVTGWALVALNKVGVGPEIGKFLIAGVIAVWNYIIYKQLIFKVAVTVERPHESQKPQV